MSMRVAFAAMLALLSWPAFGALAQAATLTPAQQAEAMDFAMHDAVFTLYHESGHLLIHELKLPVLGKEEDAADALGVIQILKNTPDRKQLASTLNDVADDWYYSSLGATKADMTAYDNHSLDIQRANTMVCMMVGADPDQFTQKAKDYGLDKDQRADCADDYRQTLDSWTTVLATHLATRPGPAIKVTYEPATDRHLRRFAEALKSQKILEGLAEQLRTTYALPDDNLSIVAKQCDDANSYYLEDDHQILYCYELADSIYRLAVDNRFDGATTASASDDSSSSAEPATAQSYANTGAPSGGPNTQTRHDN